MRENLAISRGALGHGAARADAAELQLDRGRGHASPIFVGRPTSADRARDAQAVVREAMDTRRADDQSRHRGPSLIVEWTRRHWLRAGSQ